MKKRFYLFSFLLVTASLFAQSDETSAAFSLNSPQETVHTHLYYLQPETYNIELSAKTIHAPQLSAEEKAEVAVKIKDVLDGMGVYVDVNLLPKTNNYIDSTHKQSMYFLAGTNDQIYLEKIGDNWLYSSSTASVIDKLHRQIYPLGSGFLQKIWPAALANKRILGLAVWQWLGVLLIIVATFIVYWLTKWIGQLVVRVFTSKRFAEGPVGEKMLRKLASSFSYTITFFLLAKVIPSLLLPVNFSQYLIKSIRIATIIFIAIFAVRFIAVLMVYAERFAEKTTSKLDDQLLPILNTMSKFVVSIIAIAFCLNELNVDLMAILAGLSVGALALALAAQDTVKNFIGSITIFLDHPFEIGDFIAVGDVMGSVEEVGLRATRLRTPDQSLAYIPNGQLSNMVIDNLGLRVFRRWKSELGVTYDTRTDKIEAFTKKVKEIINAHPKTASPKTEVRLNNLGPSSLNILMDIYIDVQSWNADIDVREQILLAILKAAEELGISFAFPTQTLYLEQESKKA